MRKVTEMDFRKEEFINKNPEDYEFREDGEIVRKDRWKTGLLNISHILGFQNFEIQDVIELVRKNKEELEKIKRLQNPKKLIAGDLCPQCSACELENYLEKLFCENCNDTFVED